MVAAWEEHTSAEFERKDVDATMSTMTASPFVTNVPVLTGGVGYEGVRNFYANQFLPCLPPDTKVDSVNQTVGDHSIVDEVVFKFTHTIEMPWILPGIAPTGKHVEVAIVAIALFEDGKIAGERIYWDQASVLVQLGLLDASAAPVTGIGSVQRVLDPASVPSKA
jgi:carboxymethylenebutenolidase